MDGCTTNVLLERSTSFSLFTSPFLIEGGARIRTCGLDARCNRRDRLVSRTKTSSLRTRPAVCSTVHNYRTVLCHQQYRWGDRRESRCLLTCTIRDPIDKNSKGMSLSPAEGFVVMHVSGLPCLPSPICRSPPAISARALRPFARSYLLRSPLSLFKRELRKGSERMRCPQSVWTMFSICRRRQGR